MDTAAFTFIPDVTASAIVTPATANFGDKVFITIDGTDTVFATTSTLKFPGDDIKVKDITVLNPTRVTADIVVSSAATGSSRTFTLTTVTSLADTTTTIVSPSKAAPL